MSPLLRFPATKCRQGKENGDPQPRPSAVLPGQFTRQRQIKAFIDIIQLADRQRPMELLAQRKSARPSAIRRTTSGGYETVVLLNRRRSESKLLLLVAGDFEQVSSLRACLA
jgi:hypothetical protein